MEIMNSGFNDLIGCFRGSPLAPSGGVQSPGSSGIAFLRLCQAEHHPSACYSEDLTRDEIAGCSVRVEASGEIAQLETKLAVADTLASQRQAEIERLHEICKASAQQVPGIRMALRQWVAKRLAAA